MPICPIPSLLAFAATLAILPPAAAAGLEPLPDGMARARIGDLRLYHDPGAWRIEGEAGTWHLHCRGLECDEPLMTIVAVPAELAACSPGAVIDRSAIDFPDAWTRSVTRAAAIGLDVPVATLDQGCANLAGSPVYACTLHGGTAYWFIAPGAQCRTSAQTSQGLLHLLNGLSPAERDVP